MIEVEPNTSISLRDYFAGQVLPGLVELNFRQGNPDATLIAKAAYMVADAMLAQSKNP